MGEMIEQKELIYKALKQAKVIIILDACRLDAMEKFFGFVKPVWSSGSETPQWLANTFKDKYDAVYFSANPFCSSIKNPYEWRGTDHFNKVIPVWDFGWRKVRDCYTVPPEEVFKAYEQANEPAPAILHLMQPHTPFAYSKKPLPIPISKSENVKPNDVERSKKLYPYWVEKYGAKAVRQAYYEQAEYVIKFVESHSPDEAIITADHGELLGERGMWGHPKLVCSVLRVVPWIDR